MIIRILSDEIISLLLLILLLFFSWFYWLSDNLPLFVLISVIYTLLCSLILWILKIFGPVLFLHNGEYENCISHSKKALSCPYSLIKFLQIPKLTNYFKIFIAYCYLKRDKIDEAEREILGIDNNKVLINQLVILSIIESYAFIKKFQYREALNNLTEIKIKKVSRIHLPEMFYLIAFCYLELEEELERAMSYSEMAYMLVKGNKQYQLNYAIALLKIKKEIMTSKEIFDSLIDDLSGMPSHEQLRLYYYLYTVSRDLGNSDEEKKYKDIIKTRFKDSIYCKKILS